MALYRSPEYHSIQGEYDLEEHFCKIILKSDHRPRRRCCLKVFLFLALVAFCSEEQNHFSNFGKRALEEHFCEIILKSGH